MLDNSFNEIYVFHAETLKFLQVNFGACQNLGYSEEELLWMTPIDIKPEFNTRKFQTLITPLLDGKISRLSFNTTHQRKNGSTYPVEIRLHLSDMDGEKVFLAIVQDNSERDSYLRELEKFALQDSLTGLANRTLLLDRMQQSIALAKRENRSMISVIIDPSRVREVNDTLGHYNGDELLKLIALRLQDVFRSADTLARIEGDQFAIILLEKKEDLQSLENRIKESFIKPFEIGRSTLHIGFSAGLSIHPQHGDSASELLKNADIALQTAKQQKLCFKVFNIEDNPYTYRRLKLISDLHTAIEQSEIELHYQPQVDLRNFTICGVEALARWKHSSEGYIPPSEFIQLAENTGLIAPFTDYTLQLAAARAQNWNQHGVDIPISLNLSINNLVDQRFLALVKELFNSNKLQPSNIAFEITETVLMKNPEVTLKILNELHAMGFELHIDDYGTGYSSLSYLTKLPVNHLKIDQSFIKNMLTDERAAVIVCSTVKLAHNLGIKVIAEGVEDQDTLDLLVTIGCDTVQGYLFSKPLATEDLMAWINHYQNSRTEDHKLPQIGNA